jgi:glycosyltransferase involved in cell wall biosynthesis
VIHPPIETTLFEPTDERSGRFLIVSRLRRHKRLDLAIAAATRFDLPLDIIGDGPDDAVLRADAGQTVRFHGRLPDDTVRSAMARCLALIVPGIEDFGMTLPEVQAAGRAPVAFARGGALEIIEDGVTGFLFDEPTVESLAAAMARAAETELDRATLAASARRFDRAVFDDAMLGVLADAHG